MDAQVVLQPGELFFGSGAQVRTLLGSCVAVTLWHPKRKLGGMCHFVVPSRGFDRRLNGRYGDEALAILLQRVEAAGTRPGEYVAGIFGGGDMFPEAWSAYSPRIGEQNAAFALDLMREQGFSVARQDVGATSYRSVVLDLSDGKLQVKATEVRHH